MGFRTARVAAGNATCGELGADQRLVRGGLGPDPLDRVALAHPGLEAGGDVVGIEKRFHPLLLAP